MMQTVLYIRYNDMDEYLKGEKIQASTKENSSYIFDKHREELIEVIVPVHEIVLKESKRLNGMVQGTFSYFMIQKMDKM